MIWILATRGASTKLRESPFTETAIEGVQSIIYKPGISGFVFSYDGDAAEILLAIEDPIDLIIRYRASGQKRKRTLADVIFVGDATVTVPGVNTGVSELIGVPFRVQIPPGDTLADHVTDATDP